MQTPDGRTAVDTGFIVFNEENYPNLTALFHHLGVATDATEMSFALSLDKGAYEYSGSGFGGFFGQPRNFARPRHWRLAADVARFFRTAQTRVMQGGAETSLGDFLASERYSNAFI